MDIQEDIKHCHETISYASSKFNYSVGENTYMLPSYMNLNLKSGTVGYNNKIIVSDDMFILGKNDKVHPSFTKGDRADPPKVFLR